MEFLTGTENSHEIELNSNTAKKNRYDRFSKKILSKKRR